MLAVGLCFKHPCTLRPSAHANAHFEALLRPTGLQIVCRSTLNIGRIKNHEPKALNLKSSAMIECQMPATPEIPKTIIPPRLQTVPGSWSSAADLADRTGSSKSSTISSGDKGVEWLWQRLYMITKKRFLLFSSDSSSSSSRSESSSSSSSRSRSRMRSSSSSN